MIRADSKPSASIYAESGAHAEPVHHGSGILPFYGISKINVPAATVLFKSVIVKPVRIRLADSVPYGE